MVNETSVFESLKFDCIMVITIIIIVAVVAAAAGDDDDAMESILMHLHFGRK